jgi:hypothetical protein
MISDSLRRGRTLDRYGASCCSLLTKLSFGPTQKIWQRVRLSYWRHKRPVGRSAIVRSPETVSSLKFHGNRGSAYGASVSQTHD